MRTTTLLFALALTGCRGTEEPIDADLDGVPASEDCNDDDANVGPDQVEACNGIDDNCNDLIDDSAVDATTFYADFDGDDYGNSGVSIDACDAPAGYVADSTDCDDGDAAYHPGADEVCSEPEDYNCDGSVGYADADDDGFAACEECDDGDPAISPGAVELCDGIDNNCDGAVDEDGAFGGPTWYADGDGDGYGAGAGEIACTQPTGTVANDDDCDDASETVNPAATEVCNDADDDCDGVSDDDASDATTWYADLDGDGAAGDTVSEDACTAPAGYADAATDCDDLDPDSHPSATELCDGADNDCDGSVPAEEADGDSDGFAGCDGDCDDDDAAVSPVADELCNGADDDCDGTNDEGAVDEPTWYADIDGDGQGGRITTTACEEPGGFVADSDDCNDLDAAVFTGAPEGCDGGDWDCDGNVDNDADADGFADNACGGSDCDDADDTKNPDGDACSYASCEAALNEGYTDDGVFVIDPDGADIGVDPFEGWCDMTFDGGGWLAVWNMMEKPQVNASAAEMHGSLITNEDMVDPVMPDSTSSAIYTSNVDLENYNEVVYGWAASPDDDVSRYGTYDRAGAGLVGQCYVDGYCGAGVTVATMDLHPSGTTRPIQTGNSPGYPHVGLGYSGQIIIWGYDNNGSAFGKWGNWYDGNPCCNAGNTNEMQDAGWRYSILVR